MLLFARGWTLGCSKELEEDIASITRGTALPNCRESNGLWTVTDASDYHRSEIMTQVEFSSFSLYTQTNLMNH